jgi:hypothetical protein
MGVGGKAPALAALPPGEEHATHYTGGWVGPRAGLDGCRKSPPPPGIDPPAIQPVTGRYTDYEIPAHLVESFLRIFSD